MDLYVGGVYKSVVEAEVIAKADVLVAGGGTAGVVAAIAAARNGADVLLVERQGCLGGMMTGGNAGLTKYVVHEKSQAEYREVKAAIEASESPLLEKEPKPIHGLESVYARQLTKELLSRNRQLGVIIKSMAEGILEVYSNKIRNTLTEINGRGCQYRRNSHV